MRKSMIAVPASPSLDSATVVTWNGDTGLSRISAGIIGAGNGTQGSTTATLQANVFNIGNGANGYWGVDQFDFRSTGLIQWSSGSNATLGFDTYLGRGGVATLQLGQANAAAPVAQILTSQGSRGGTDSNIAGGNLTIQPGTGTGNSTPSQCIHSAPALGTASGTTAQTIVKRVVFNATKTGLTTGSATSLIDIALTTLGMAGGQVNYLIEATDGTDMCTTSGSINYAAVNKATVYTQQVSSIGNLATACSAGSLTAAWTLVSGTNKTTLKVTPTLVTVVATTFRITYEISHYGQQDITIL